MRTFCLTIVQKWVVFKGIQNFGQILEIWILSILTLFTPIALNSKPIYQFSIWKLMMNPKYLSYHLKKEFLTFFHWESHSTQKKIGPVRYNLILAFISISIKYSLSSDTSLGLTRLVLVSVSPDWSQSWSRILPIYWSQSQI